MPNLRIENFGGSLKVLFADNTDLTRGRRFTFLSEDVVATGTTFRVQSIVGFESLSTSSGQIVCIGEIGNEKTEVLRTSNTTPPGPGRLEISLRDSLAFDHSQDTKVYIVDWNRIAFTYAASATGTRTTLNAYPVQVAADQKETLFRDITEAANRLTGAPATAFYFAQFNESIGDRNSNVSDAVYGTGYDANMVFAIKKRAIDSLGEEVDGNIITHEFLNTALWEARREYHQAPGKRPFRRKFNVDIGDALTGSYRIDLPGDVEDPASGKNVYGVRIGANANMIYYDKKEWDFDFRNKPHSTLDVPYTRGTSTSIWLASGRDFSGSPTISVEGMNIGCTRITGSQNSFTITTHGSYPSALAGSDAWENITYGLPDKFTVWAEPGGSAYIYFNKPIATVYVNQNIYADYYRTLVGYDSDADVLDEPDYDMFTHYLMAKIKHRKARGSFDITADPDYKLWQFKKTNALANEYLATQIRITPEVSHLDIPA